MKFKYAAIALAILIFAALFDYAMRTDTEALCQTGELYGNACL